MRKLRLMACAFALACGVGSLHAAPPLSFTFQITNQAPTTFNQPNSVCTTTLKLPAQVTTKAPTLLSHNPYRLSCPSTMRTGSRCVMSAEASALSGNPSFGFVIAYETPLTKSYQISDNQLQANAYHYPMCSTQNVFPVLNDGDSHISTNNGTLLNLDASVIEYFKGGSTDAETVVIKGHTIQWPSSQGLTAVCHTLGQNIASWSWGQGWSDLADFTRDGIVYNLPTPDQNQANILQLTKAIGCVPDVVYLKCTYTTQRGLTGYAAINTNISSNAALGQHEVSSTQNNTVQCYPGTKRQSYRSVYYPFNHEYLGKTGNYRVKCSINDQYELVCDPPVRTEG